MDSQHIVRVPRSDNPENFVLVNVTRTGKSELDLKLVATEGEDPYVGSVKQSRIKNLRAKNYQDSDEEWADILAHVFVQNHNPEVPQQSWISGLEVVATVKEVDDDEKELTITLRKRIDGITQRLGGITLKQDDDQAIQLFEWNGIAVARANTLETQIKSLTGKYRVAEETIGKLNTQLEELIQAKTDHDDQLIAKFVQLLNEKKLKIRNQQRLLASAKVDSNKVAELDAASEAQSHAAGPSRRGKRKAVEEEPAESEESEGFDRMSIDAGKPGDAGENDEVTATDSDRQSTPEPLEDETLTGDDDDDEDRDPQTITVRKGLEQTDEEVGESDNNGGKKSQPILSRRSAVATQKSTSGQTEAKKTASPPPRRDLPFNRRAAGRGTRSISRASTPATADLAAGRKSAQPEPKQTVEERDGEQTGGETDDDEL